MYEFSNVNIDQLSISEEELVASLCREDFYTFVQEFWHTIIQADPVWNWHIKYLCEELQFIAERVFRNEPKLYDLLINIPPGTTKSTIVSEMFPAWVWTRMSHARFICGSHSHDLAKDLSRKTRDIIQSDKYKSLFPDVQLREDQNAKSEFHTVTGGMRFAVGVTGSVIGRHAHFLMVDDPIDPQAALSEADLNSANNWMTETLPTRKVDKAVSVSILVMQRIHQNDPAGVQIEKIEKGAKIKHICLPAEMSPDVNPPQLKEHYVDGLLDPIRLSRDVLNQAEIDLLEFGYAGQFQQNPVPRGGGLIHTDKIQEGLPLPVRFDQIVRYWDKAGTLGGGCYTAGVKLGITPDKKIWILDVIRGQWDSATRENIIRQTAELDGYAVKIGVEQEPGSGGKESAENTVKNLMGFTVEVDRPTGDKALRADPFAVQVNGNNVACVTSGWTQEYKKELKNFPNSKYKDQVDATSGAFSMLCRPVIVVGGAF